jgi:hypothetical protein
MAYNLPLPIRSINLNVMKKLTYNLGSLFLIVGLFWISYSGNSQDIKLNKQEQREAKRAEMYANFQYIDTMLERKDFVLEADYLENQYGFKRSVPSILNFIKVDSSNVVLQTGSNTYFGFNGVGGVTTEGRLERLKIVKNFKNLSYTLEFSVMTNIGVYDISMMINADRYARATISSMTRGTLIYDGHIVPFTNSIVYKGQNTY